MSKTGIERLRGLYVEWIGGDYLVALSDMIQETADQIEREHAEELEALEPRLMPEDMEWLCYNDGEKVLPTDEWIECPKSVELEQMAILDLLRRQRELDARTMGGE